MQRPKKRINYLLVIGISKYQNDMYSDLPNSVNDSLNLVKVLTEHYSFELAFDPILDSAATRREIIEKLSHLSHIISAEDNLVIYYAGHGSMNPSTKKGYWVPNDASNSESDYISNSTIKDKLEDINAKHIFLISDSCFSGTFLSQTRAASSVGNHYAKLDIDKSRWYLASGKEETVSDGKQGDGSPFSKALLKLFNENDSEFMSVFEIINYVTKLTGTNTTQQPVGGHIDGIGHQLGQMVFTKTKIAEDNISEDEFFQLADTYSYYLSQSYSIKTLSDKFPILRFDLIIAEAKWKNSFLVSVNRIIENMKKIVPNEAWEQFNIELEEGIKKQIDGLDISFDETLSVIGDLNLRAQGIMPQPYCAAFINNIPEIADNPIMEYIKNFKQSIGSSNWKKSKGLNFIIEYPRSWTIRDGKRPNVLWLAKNYFKNIISTSTVQLISDIYDIDIDSVESTQAEEVADAILEEENVISSFSAQSPENVNFKRVVIDGCFGAVADFDGTFNQLDTTIKYYCRVYLAVYSNYITTVNFQVNIASMKMDRLYYNKYFDLIMNSFVVKNRYS
ncbi:caspase family protein [Fibrella arboris]|uniref:caspase family protein n=1 Tax=Fibrella arboris TaxID=3242486 RepID=UPI003520DCF1